jgi:hypothetical protein
VDEEEEPKAYCTNCQSVGVHNKLKSRILNKGEVKSPDYDDFKQCHECGTIVPLYEVKNQGKLEGIVEPSDNPF